MKDSQCPVFWQDKERYRLLLSHWDCLAKHLLRYHFRHSYTPLPSNLEHIYLWPALISTFSKTAPKLFLHFSWIANKEKEDASQKVLFQQSTLMTLPQIDTNTTWFIHSCGSSSSVSPYLPYGRKNTLKKINLTVLAPSYTISKSTVEIPECQTL